MILVGNADLQRELARKWSNLDWTEVDLLHEGQSTSDEELLAIGGCARSGTTLLRVILDSHSHFVVGPPTNVFIPTPLDLSDIAKRLSLARHIIDKMYLESRDRVQFIGKLSAECRRVYQKMRWGEKTARNVHRFGWILDRFPRARVAHVIRDGRDVVCSLRKHRRRQVIDGNIFEIDTIMPLQLCAMRWARSIEDGIAHRDNPRYYEIYYERLVADPESALSNLCSFLGVQFETSMLNFHTFKGPLRDPLLFPQNLEATMPLYSSSVGRWKRDLAVDEQRYVEDSLGPLLVKLGYLR